MWNTGSQIRYFIPYIFGLHRPTPHRVESHKIKASKQLHNNSTLCSLQKQFPPPLFHRPEGS